MRPVDRRGASRDSGVHDMGGRDLAARRGGERGWDEAGRDDRRQHLPAPPGPNRAGRAGARDYDNRASADELMAPSAPPSRGAAGRGGPRTDEFDRTARTPGRDHSRGQDTRGQDSGRSISSREAVGRDAGRDERERRGNTGPNARPDSRRAAAANQSRRDDSLPDIKPRPSKTSKSKRDDDGDWPSTEWDELSDVDYWTELAADKPFTGSATSSTTQPGRPDRDRGDKRAEADSGPIRANRRESPDRREREGRDRDSRQKDGRDRQSTERRDGAERRDSRERRDQLLPAARVSRQTVDAAFAPPVSGDPIDKAFGARTDVYGSTELRRAIAGGRTPTTGPQRVQPADDDPLTSPSFPRVTADDSRSYRRSGGRGQGDSSSQTRPHQAYPAAPAHPPVGPLDSQPGLGPNSGGYSQPATNGVEYAAAPLADPYHQPRVAAADSLQPVSGSYPTPAPAASYLPTGNGYQADSLTSGGYVAPLPTAPSYSSAAPGSYPGADPASYQTPLSGPSQVGYTADHSSGYPPPAQAPGGYSVTPAASYPAQPAEHPDYSGYPGAGHNQVGQSSPGQPPAQPQSTGFSYSHQADPGFDGQLPTGSYVSGYQPPTYTGQAGMYQMPQTDMVPPQAVQPGHPTVPYNPASAPQAQSGYPAAGFEADSGYSADPYAVDPYGYPGYGAARLPDQVAGLPDRATRLPDQRWRAQPLSDQSWEERSWHDPSWDDQPGAAKYRYREQPYDQYWEGDR